jgi:hypothetical protein
MPTRIFVPMTDQDLDRAAVAGATLVPYHPDRPCWRLAPDPGPRSGASPGNQHRPHDVVRNPWNFAAKLGRGNR